MLALLLAATALSPLLGGCGMTGMMGDLAARDVEAKAKPASPQTYASDLDGNLRQAKLLREAGNYDEAIHILSQLMLAAADDPRVSAEYGKALAQKGRADVAVQFLTRAIQLAPNDWTLYSAMGVSYDQLGDSANAKLAYDHALALKPGDPGVLNNYALSRMLAKDPQGAQLLIAQAQAAAGGTPDEKIARNVELINGMAPKAADLAKDAKPTALASAKKLPAPTIVAPAAPQVAAALPAPPAPPIAVVPTPAPPPAVAAAAAQAGGPKNAGDVARLLASQAPVPAANGAPRQLAPQVAANQPHFEAQPISQAPAGVVMQKVPYDPFAGPVIALKKPRPKTLAKAAPAKGDTVETAKAEAPAAKPTRTAAKADVVPSLRLAADKY
jgi:Flp pilus assembly protein TadD